MIMTVNDNTQQGGGQLLASNANVNFITVFDISYSQCILLPIKMALLI